MDETILDRIGTPDDRRDWTERDTRATRPAETGAEGDGAALVIRERDIRSASKRTASARHLGRVLLRQAYYEGWVRRWKGVQFRQRRNEAARRAYCAMAADEFEGINARQAWANWRTIPRNLSGRAPARPLKAIDLCCGTGHSTEVLAHYLADGSEILGLEYNPRFVDVARSRRFFHDGGAPARVRFNTQSVLETFRGDDGAEVADRSVDLVNSSGAVGCHFDADATSTLADEVARVLRPGGLALIDSGSGGTGTGEVVEIFHSRGFHPLNRARSCFLDRYTQVCFRRNGNG